MNASRPFVGVDGEGVTLDNGYHAYNMLSVGTRTVLTQGSNVRLSSFECLDFISSLDPGNIYVGYFFDYDVTKILEDLPFAKLDRLVHRHKRMGANGALFPVDWMDFQIEYLPHKEFKVRRKLAQTDYETTWSKWIVINDVGSFFQVPFLTAIKQWNVGTELEWEAISVGKSGRANFTLSDAAEVHAYNQMEIKLLQTLMDSFRSACVKVGYVPKQWQGPGLLAETMLRAHGVPQSRDVPLLTSEDYRGLVSFARNAYYGGRTEVGIIGPVTDPVYQYDINSAYPHAMRVVPCLLHGEWRHYEGKDCPNIQDYDRPSGRIGETYCLAYGSFTDRDYPRTLWYGLPVRTKQGTIVFPADGSGWYWSFEIQSGIHQSFLPSEMWVYTRQCSCRPLIFVEEVYRQRQAIGKDGPGIVLKLGMNSLYGKTVQSIGFPKYANPIWGSFLTAYPRMMIQDFIHSSPFCRDGRCGYDVLMIATDSVATTLDRSDYPESKELGGWSRETHKNGIFVVQPGVYFGSCGKPNKTRGVPRTVVDAYESEFRERYKAMVESGRITDGDVAVPQKLFAGIKYAIHRHNMTLLGQWIEFKEDAERPGKLITFDWTTKRAIYPTIQKDGYIQTFPYQGLEDIETVPYSKDIGGLQLREELREIWEDQPDWIGVMYEDD